MLNADVNGATFIITNIVLLAEQGLKQKNSTFEGETACKGKGSVNGEHSRWNEIYLR